MNERRPVLAVQGAGAEYVGRPVLENVSIEIRPGERVALIGHNGAGKTTLCRCVFGLHPFSAGRVAFMGADITNTPPYTKVQLGMAFTPQGRNVFPTLTVEDNLRLSVQHVSRKEADIRARQQDVFEVFPILGERRHQLAGMLSGGQQQMLALGMALMTKPRLLILDEPSTGLAPVLVDTVLEGVRRINEQYGTAVLLIDQNVSKVLAMTDCTYVLKRGRIIHESPSEELLAQESLWHLF